MSTKSTLYVGAGSGRDLMSALLIALHESQTVTGFGLAGILTPWAVHTRNGKIERAMNRSDGRWRKFIPGAEQRDVGGFFEPLVQGGLTVRGIPCRDVSLLSIHHGSHALRNALGTLVAREGYERVVLVDPGGDILARVTHGSGHLTPIVDHTVLCAVEALPSDVEKRCIVLAPGIDGELRPNELRGAIDALVQSIAISCTPIGSLTGALEVWIEFNEWIEQRTGSLSQTYSALVDRLRGATPDHGRIQHIRRYQIENSVWDVMYEHTLDPTLSLHMYSFRPADLLARWGEIILDYESACEAHLLFRSLGPSGTELDVARLPMGSPLSHGEGVVQTATPCDRTPPDVFAAIEESALRALEEGKVAAGVFGTDGYAASALPDSWPRVTIGRSLVVEARDRDGLWASRLRDRWARGCSR